LAMASTGVWMLSWGFANTSQGGLEMSVELVDRTYSETSSVPASAVVFDTLPELGMDRMTEGRVEFVLCASALTAQV
jgi:hypothetical protein